VRDPSKPASKTTALHILIFRPVSFTQDSVRQKTAYIAQLCGETALERG